MWCLESCARGPRGPAGDHGGLQEAWPGPGTSPSAFRTECSHLPQCRAGLQMKKNPWPKNGWKSVQLKSVLFGSSAGFHRETFLAETASQCPEQPFRPLAGPPPSEDHPSGILYLEGPSQPLGQIPPTPRASDSVVCIPSSSDRPGGLSQGSDSSLRSQGDAEAAGPHPI